MKAISLWQPWASLWCSPAKLHETRHWPINHRGWLLVHAAKRAIPPHLGDELEDICDGTFGNGWHKSLPLGAIVGMVNLAECISTGAMPEGHELTADYLCGNFQPGRWAWRRLDFVVFKNPRPFRGQQGLFEVPDDVVEYAA